MASSKIAIRYARALFKTLDDDLSRGESACKLLSVVQDLFENKDAGSILKSPVMPLDLKVELLDYAYEVGKETSVCKELKDFSNALAEAGRIGLFPDIICAFQRIIKSRQGIMDALVTSAFELEGADQQQIGSVLSTAFGKQVTLASEIDKDLLGGFTVKIENFEIDLSIKARLEVVTRAALLPNTMEAVP
jgi:F-type H+-transporting ATPase subunit delta